MAVFRVGDEEKLNSRGGWGGYESDGSAYCHSEFDWPGGDSIAGLLRPAGHIERANGGHQ